MPSTPTARWVAKHSGRYGDRTHASDRSVVRTITVGGDPVGIASDGNHVWVANQESEHLHRVRRLILTQRRPILEAGSATPSIGVPRMAMSSSEPFRSQVLDYIGKELIKRSVAPDDRLPKVFEPDVEQFAPPLYQTVRIGQEGTVIRNMNRRRCIRRGRGPFQSVGQSPGQRRCCARH